MIETSNIYSKFNPDNLEQAEYQQTLSSIRKKGQDILSEYGKPNRYIKAEKFANKKEVFTLEIEFLSTKKVKLGMGDSLSESQLIEVEVDKKEGVLIIERNLKTGKENGFLISNDLYTNNEDLIAEIKNPFEYISKLLKDIETALFQKEFLA